MLTPKDTRPRDGAAGGDARVYDATAKFFEGELSSDELGRIAKRLSSASPLVDGLRSCAVFGYGSQSSATYRRLKRLHGVEVIWDGDGGPWWLRPLTFIAASRFGLVEVLDRRMVAPVLEALSTMAMVEVYSFPRRLNQTLREHVRARKWRSVPGAVIGSDPGYFCFGVDGDNYDVSSGILGWCSFGNDCPSELRSSVLDGPE